MISSLLVFLLRKEVASTSKDLNSPLSIPITYGTIDVFFYCIEQHRGQSNPWLCFHLVEKSVFSAEEDCHKLLVPSNNA
jgi:hypothetical protein